MQKPARSPASRPRSQSQRPRSRSLPRPAPSRPRRAATPRSRVRVQQPRRVLSIAPANSSMQLATSPFTQNGRAITTSSRIVAHDLLSVPLAFTNQPTTVGLVDSILLNPFHFTGSRTALLQQAYSKFRFLSCSARWRPAVPTSVSGDIIVHYQPDARIPPFPDSITGLQALLTASGTVMNAAWTNFSTAIPVSRSTNDHLYAATRGADLRQWAQGRLDLYATPSSATATNTLGYLLLEYGIDMAGALLGTLAQSLPAAPKTYAYNSTVSLASSASWANVDSALPALYMNCNALTPAAVAGDVLRVTIMNATIPAGLQGGTASLASNSVFYVRVNTLNANAQSNGNNNYCYRAPESAHDTIPITAGVIAEYAPSAALTVAAATSAASTFTARIEFLSRVS